MEVYGVFFCAFRFRNNATVSVATSSTDSVGVRENAETIRKETVQPRRCAITQKTITVAVCEADTTT